MLNDQLIHFTILLIMSTKRSALGRAQKNMLARARAINTVARKANQVRGRAMSMALAPMSGRYLNRRGVSKETGYVDLAAANYAFDTTGTIVLAATVAQGASVNQRIGKKIVWKSIQCRGTGFSGTTTVASDTAFLVVYDRRPTGALPAITDILVTASSTSMNNDVNSGRFSILKRIDQQFIGNITAPATGKEAFTFDFFLDLKMRPGVFKAAASGAIGDIEEGAIYLVSVGSVAAGTTAPTLNAGFRTRFIDV